MPPLDLEAKKRRLTMLGYIIRYNSPVTRELVSDVSDVERGGGRPAMSLEDTIVWDAR